MRPRHWRRFQSALIAISIWLLGIGTGVAADPDKNAAPMTDIHDIKPALVMGHDLRWLYWTLAILVVLALAALVWRRWLKRGKPAAADSAPPPLPPDAEALQRLDALAAGGDLVDPKQFYFRLSAVVRCYVERRFNIPAAEMTTEELLPRVDRLPMEPELAHTLKAFCRAADPVKFAGAPADPGRMAHDLAFAREFVRRTSAPAEPTAEAAGEDLSPAPVQEEVSTLPVLNRTSQ